MNMLIVLSVIILQLYPVSGILCPETGLKFVENPTNCETFFVCNNGIATLLECSVGMQFDKSTGFCSRAEDVKCVTVELPIPLEIPSVPEIESEEEYETELQTEHENEHGLESETEINDDFKQECPENGLKFFPNPQSCTSFIKCINGKEYFLECPVGLHFDETTAFCDRPENVNCIESVPVPDVESETEAEAKPETDPEIKPETEAETQPEIEPEAEPEIEPETESETEPEIELETKPEIELETEPETEHEVEPETETEDALKVECPENGLQFLPHPKSCTSFIKCLNGAVFLLECPTGLQFDETTGFCDRPENVNCLAGELPEPDEETQDISVECPEEGHNFLPHPVDCEKFIECKFGVQLIQNCASGLHWNAANGFCDFVNNAHCDIPGTEIELEPDIEPETEVEVKPEIGPETEPETDPEIEPETELATEPEEEPEIEHEVELETDPETELEIESGTEPEIELELEPETEPETESETKPEIDPETEHEIETETETEDGFKVYCPENGFKFFSNPQSCTSFAKCLNGVAYFLECPAGQYFDDTTGFCDRPKNVNCAAEGLPEPDDEKPNISMECPEEGHYFLPHPADCEKFIECKFGFQVIHNCAPGFHWDSTNGFCNFAENVKCQIPEDEIEPGPAPDVESETEVVEKPETESGTEAETEPDTEPETETGPEPEIEPETELETKPETEPETETETETEFEPEPEPEFETEPETELESESETEPETELVTESETEYEIESETESGDELEPEPESENHKPGPIGKCPPLDGATGTFLADGADCNVFYICVWGEPARKECNSGLHFNPEMMICDWPSQAGCKSTNY